LSARRITHAVVKSRECLSLRHLLSNIYHACLFATNPGEDDAANARGSRCDSVNALSANLQELLHEREEKVVLVLDGIDKQRGLYPSILPALARLGDIACAAAYHLAEPF
jgi:origin recognition complex subunit 5